MFGFLNFKKKKPKEDVPYESAPKELRCPFCLATIDPDKVVFAADEGSDRDETFEGFVSDFAYMDEIAFTNHSGEIRNQDDLDVIQVIRTKDGFPTSIRVMGADGREVPFARRLCGACHCELPESIETSQMRMVMLMGGSSSGKTMYMAALADSLQTQLAQLGLGHVELMAESKAAMEHIIKVWQESSRKPSVKNMSLFPMVISITDLTRPGGRRMVLSIHDFAGEGMREQTYLTKYVDKKPDAILYTMDVYQMSGLSQSPKVENTCGETVANCFGKFGQEQIAAFSNVEAVAVILTKIDVLINLHKNVLKDAQYRAYTPALGDDHRRSVDVAVIKDVSLTVQTLLQEHADTALETIYSMLSQGGRSPGYNPHALQQIEFFAVSTMQVTDEVTTNDEHMNKFIPGAPMHRVVEPILYILAKWGVLDTK